jgi:hypothetical protein
MSIKFIPKVGAAVALLVIILIFLGVNYVPKIYALSLPKQNSANTIILARSDYVDELYPRAIVPKLSFSGSGYERHLQANALQGSSQLNSVDKVNLARPDYVDELYPRAIVPHGASQLNIVDRVNRVRPDYVDERYPRAIVP